MVRFGKMQANPGRPVLVVEDDAQIRDVIEELLRMEGYPSQCATDGAQAIALVRSGVRPSVILLDSMMPRMNGEQFLKVRGADPDLAAIPVYLISASGNLDETTERYRVEGFLRKPFDPDRLLEIVRRHCPRGSSA